MARRLKPFTTTNRLTFETFETPIVGFAGFKLGETVGLFSQNELITDVVPTDIPNPEHLVDLVDWFCEVGRLSGTMVRISGPKSGSIEDRLTKEFKFYKNSQGAIARGEWLLSKQMPLTRRQKRENERISKIKSIARR